MNIPDYLARIQYVGPIEPNLETLKALHLAHMLAIPFENLDIELKRRIVLEESALWKKIIVKGRGGFCYELNGLFAWLLKQIGFHVTFLNARVFNREGRLGIEFDHLALLVELPEESGRWLADVGFGDSFTAPLSFDSGSDQSQGLRAYRLERHATGFIVRQMNYDGSWEQRYYFDLIPRDFPREYEAACIYHQTSPQSSFTRESIISRALENGRISLENGRLILTRDGQRTAQALASGDEYRGLLEEHFGIVL